MAATFDLRRLPGSRGFEAIRTATKLLLLYQLISVYVIFKMAAAHTKVHCLIIIIIIIIIIICLLYRNLHMEYIVQQIKLRINCSDCT